LKICALKFARVAGPLALIALVCTLMVQPRGTVRTADLKKEAERPHIELTDDNHARSFSTAIVADEIPEMATDESVAEKPAIQGSWAREMRELRELAMHDSAAALVRISEMSVAEEREAALKEVCLQLAANNPAQAMDAAWRFHLGRLGGMSESTTLEDLAAQWAATDLSAALAWVSQLPLDEAGRRDRVVKGVAFAWSEKSPASAARLVVEQMSPDYAQSDAAIQLAGRWAIDDFVGAAAWVDLFPEGSIRDRAKEELSKVLLTQQQ
jgi:hypothetical protein